MIAQNDSIDSLAEGAGLDQNLSILLQGSEIHRIEFVAERTADQQVVLEFSHPIRAWAVIVDGDRDSTEPAATRQLSILSVPNSRQENAEGNEGETLSAMREWLSAATSSGEPPITLMTLQGAQILWTPGRLAILAHPDRIETVRNALIESLYYEGEIRDIERTLGDIWPQLEADTPLAFEMDQYSIGKKKQLLQRFSQVLQIRARLARIAPHVHCPHLHPPTLASQVAERLRERTRMTHRHDFLREQIEIFDRVYEMCGERASNFTLARSGNTLEWIIIVLLLAQLLLAGFELLTSTSTGL